MKLFLRAFCALLLTAATARAVPVTVRVADAQGRPVAGANVEYADYAEMTDEKPSVGQFAKTAANGTLALDLRGVSGRAGEVEIRVGDKLVLGSARVRDNKLGFGTVPLFAGDNTLTLRETSRVAGIVRAPNDAPLAGAQVKFVGAEKDENTYFYRAAQYGVAPIVATTDAAGRWEIADLPRGYADFVVSAPGFVGESLDFSTDKAETAAPDLKMRAAGRVRGRITDFRGQPVALAYAYLEDEYGDVAYSDREGRFELSGVPLGEVALEFNSAAPNWTGVSAEIKATVPAQNAVVDIGDVRTDEGVLITGSVVDNATKAPVANLKLKLDIWGTTLQTDAQGRFEARIQERFYGLKVLGNYDLKTSFSWSPEDVKQFDVGTIEVERLGATFTGRVTDQRGAVAGARVSWNRADQFEFAATDEGGNFQIENLPYKPLTIRASDGLRLAQTTATPGVPVELKLPPATFTPDAEIEKLWNELKIRRISDLGRYTEALGARRVFETARRFDAQTNPKQIGQGLDDYLSDRARGARTPEQRADIAREGVELLQRFDASAWSLGMGEIALLAAQTDDDELRAFAARWYDAQKSRVRQPDSPDKLEWYHSALTERVMSVGAALGRPDAEKYRDIWLGQIDTPDNKYPEAGAPDWGETLWRANPQWFDEIVGKWAAPTQMRALTGALAAEREPAKAKALLARLEKLASDPAVVTADAEAAQSDSMSPISQSASTLYRARLVFARSMAPLDAPAALDALDKVRAVVQSAEIYQIAATIARTAIKDGNSEIARRALNLGLLKDADSWSAPMLALVARPFDAELAAQLMEVARKNSRPNNSSFEPAGWADVANYAVALREFDAGVGRLLLEDQWARRQQPAKSRIDDAEYNQRELIKAQEKLAWAMAFYDVGRALQWLSEVKDDRDKWNNGLERTRLAIVVAALTPPEKRSLLLGATYFD